LVAADGRINEEDGIFNQGFLRIGRWCFSPRGDGINLQLYFFCGVEFDTTAGKQYQAEALDPDEKRG
jgi:hypothetical protein